MRDQELLKHAKTLRTLQTEPETRLWLRLRAKRLRGAKSRRQVVIGPFIVDFACRPQMVVVELDGDSHSMQQQYDKARTRYLEERGYRVVRFANHDVMENLEGVLDRISEIVGSAPLPTLSPEGERA